MSAEKKALQAAKKSIKLIAVDYDGTVFDHVESKFNHDRAAKLLVKIMHQNIHLVVISARDASFRKSVIPLIQPQLKLGDIKCYFGGGNGAYLMRLTKNKASPVYSYSMDDSEIGHVMGSYHSIIDELKLEIKDLQPNGISIFNKFLQVSDSWSGVIPKKLVHKSRSHSGALFIERSKISCVLPSNTQLKKEFERMFSDQLCKDFNIKGDATFIHIGKKIWNKGRPIDNKLFALRTVMTELGIKKHEVISFGDSPTGNDQAMLKALPISFTNNGKRAAIRKRSPYFLSGELNPVEKVHNAISYIIDAGDSLNTE